MRVSERRIAGALGAAGVVACLVLGAARPARAERRPVDLAICLDTSGSMSGLINSARQKLWQIVNELAEAKPTPHLRVALITYGSPAYGSDTGWVKVQLDLTDDLDLVYERLMALRTSGGTEYVARAVTAALDSLSWDQDQGLKVVFVAGNESADQDPEIPNKRSCARAGRAGVIVNAIYCGSESDSQSEGYRHVASLGGGRFAAIDHDRGTVTISTPYDRELMTLSRELNSTYIAYGAKRRESAARQKEQDRNAESLSPSVAAQRAGAKSSALYRNEGWDLVDAKAEGRDISEIPEEELPEEMREMSPEEREEHVSKLAERRDGIKARIKQLTEKRNAYVKAEMEKNCRTEEGAFDYAVRAAARAQAEASGFSF
ncbi:MAG: vWA domain-containing protein [Planctomycetota bacterium]|jgi:Mg-chelatase subunit ChlD